MSAAQGVAQDPNEKSPGGPPFSFARELVPHTIPLSLRWENQPYQEIYALPRNAGFKLTVHQAGGAGDNRSPGGGMGGAAAAPPQAHASSQQQKEKTPPRSRFENDEDYESRIGARHWNPNYTNMVIKLQLYFVEKIAAPNSTVAGGTSNSLHSSEKKHRSSHQAPQKHSRHYDDQLGSEEEEENSSTGSSSLGKEESSDSINNNGGTQVDSPAGGANVERYVDKAVYSSADSLTVTLGNNTLVKGLECALRTMQVRESAVVIVLPGRGYRPHRHAHSSENRLPKSTNVGHGENIHSAPPLYYEVTVSNIATPTDISTDGTLLKYHVGFRGGNAAASSTGAGGQHGRPMLGETVKIREAIQGPMAKPTKKRERYLHVGEGTYGSFYDQIVQNMQVNEMANFTVLSPWLQSLPRVTTEEMTHFHFCHINVVLLEVHETKDEVAELLVNNLRDEAKACKDVFDSEGELQLLTHLLKLLTQQYYSEQFYRQNKINERFIRGCRRLAKALCAASRYEAAVATITDGLRVCWNTFSDEDPMKKNFTCELLCMKAEIHKEAGHDEEAANSAVSVLQFESDPVKSAEFSELFRKKNILVGN